MERYHLLYEDFDVAEKNGISRRTLVNRVENLGWTIDKAVNEPLRTTSRCKVWSRWEAIALKNGIRRATFQSRMNRGLTAQEAATKPLRHLTSKYSKEEHEVMKANGLTTNTVNTRMKVLGWSRYDAIHTPKMSEKERAERVREGTRKHHQKRKEGKADEEST